MKQLLDVLKIYVLGSLAALLLMAIHKSLRIKWRTLSSEGATIFESPAKIIAFWHGRQLMIPMEYWAFRSPKKNPVNALVSMHSDGRLIAFAISLFGVRNVAGSSSKGGSEATKLLIDKLRSGESVGITPDGPRGPIHQAKPGAIKIAATTGCPIYPISFSAKKRWQFGSWDKMILPKPFSEVVIVIGEPFTIKEELNDTSLARLTNELNERLLSVEREADATWK